MKFILNSFFLFILSENSPSKKALADESKKPVLLSSSEELATWEIDNKYYSAKVDLHSWTHVHQKEKWLHVGEAAQVLLLVFHKDKVSSTSFLSGAFIGGEKIILNQSDWWKNGTFFILRINRTDGFLLLGS